MNIEGLYIADKYSLPSLYIMPCAKYTEEEIELGTATGFVVKYNNINFLVTNRHVLSGVNTNDKTVINKNGAIPNLLRIFHHVEPNLTIHGYGAWALRYENLIDQCGKTRWYSHPKWDSTNTMEYYLEKNIDIAVLPLVNIDRVGFHYIDIFANEITTNLPPGISVSIVGYPLAISNDLFPIWKTGHIASDITTHHSQLYFYIDATTRSGMSGSPVYYRNYFQYSRDTIHTQTYLIGLYSGRIHKESEIGIVWRQKYIQETIEYAYKDVMKNSKLNK
ncbi:MAG: trypsin-like serine peptidase [Aminipila sp.]